MVCQEAEQLALKTAGFTDVRLGGLPFAYIQRQHTHCQTDALLAFPPHSAEVGRVTADQGVYFDYLETLKHDFESIYVCVHYLDMNGPLHKDALAWPARGQIKGYATGLRRRLSCSIISRMVR